MKSKVVKFQRCYPFPIQANMKLQHKKNSLNCDNQAFNDLYVFHITLPTMVATACIEDVNCSNACLPLKILFDNVLIVHNTQVIQT